MSEDTVNKERMMETAHNIIEDLVVGDISHIQATKRISQALLQVRRETVEEAAKVAESLEAQWRLISEPSAVHEVSDVASAIRQLLEEGKS